LIDELPGKVDHVLIDRLNDTCANRTFKENKMEWAWEDSFLIQKAKELKEGFKRKGLPVQVLF
jgi:hypothetical protein